MSKFWLLIKFNVDSKYDFEIFKKSKNYSKKDPLNLKILINLLVYKNKKMSEFWLLIKLNVDMADWGHLTGHVTKCLILIGALTED